MRKMYKLLCCIFALVAVINVLGCYDAYAEDKTLDEDMRGKMEVLRLLHVIPDYYDYNVDLGKEMTRADFAASLARIIDLNEFEEEYIYYYDVPQSHWAYNEICALTERKILNGAGNKLFHPDEYITKPEAYKMALSMLGYDEYAQAIGGYPYGYISAAKRVDLEKGVSSAEYVTMGDMFSILYNTMTAELFETVVYTNNGTEYKEKNGQTLLTVYRNIYYSEGMVQGTDCITMDGNIIDEGCAMIANIIYDTDIDMMQYFGETVKFFYHLDKSADARVILWAAENGNTDKLYIKADNDASFDEASYSLTYYSEGSDRSRRIQLERGITVLYNGGLSEKKISDIFNMPRYTAKFVKNSNGKYDIAVINAYENIVVDKIDAVAKTVYDKHNPSKKLILDENEYEIVSIEMAGKSGISFAEIKNGDVLSYYMSEDENYLTVQISNEQALGIVDTIAEVGNGRSIYISGTEYFMPDTVGSDRVVLGDNVIAYLDINKEIAYVRIVGKDNFAAYLIDNALDGGAFKETVKFRLLKYTGEITILECSQKVKVDGEVFKDAENVFEYFRNNGEFSSQIAMLTLDLDGKIKTIDTVIHNEDKGENTASLTVSVPYAIEQEFRNTGIIGAKSVINENTVIFSVPLNPVGDYEDDDYGIISRWDIGDKAWINAETYKTAEKVGFEQYVVLRGFDINGYNSYEAPVLVENLGRMINSEGDTVECVYGYKGGQEVSYALASGVGNLFSDNGVQEGSNIWLKHNKAGEVDNLKHLFSYAEPNVYTFDSNIDSEYRTTYGYVNDIVDSVLKIGYNDPAVVDQVMLTEGVPVLIYDTQNNRNRITIGNINDAVTYYNEGNNCSEIVMVTQWRNPKVFVVYK